MRFESKRAREYFELANKHLDFEDKPSMFAARAMQHIYFNLLKKIEAKSYNIFDENIKCLNVFFLSSIIFYNIYGII